MELFQILRNLQRLLLFVQWYALTHQHWLLTISRSVEVNYVNHKKTAMQNLTTYTVILELFSWFLHLFIARES